MSGIGAWPGGKRSSDEMEVGREKRGKRRERFRLAPLHNFIVLSAVFTARWKKTETRRKGTVYYAPGKNSRSERRINARYVRPYDVSRNGDAETALGSR